MQDERYNEFLNRILDETPMLDNHFRENPELAHDLRIADVVSTLMSYRFCAGTREHWNCLCATQNLTRQLYSLMIVRPTVLEEIYADFKPDFKKMLPEGTIYYKGAEAHEYPVPEHLLNPPEETH